MILRFNEDIVKQGVALHPSAYLFNLYRREPEPLEDARYSDLPAESRLFLADDVAQFKTYLEELVPHKAKNDVLCLKKSQALVKNSPRL
jgi:hypothetical protein